VRPGSQMLSFEVEDATSDVARALRLAPREKVVSLRRVRLAGSMPMGIEWSRLPVRLCPDLIDTFDPTTSLYRVLCERYGIEIVVADEVVEATLADAEESHLLRFPKGHPVFAFTRTSYIQSGQPVEYVKSVYRGDRYKLVNRLTQANRSVVKEN